MADWERKQPARPWRGQGRLLMILLFNLLTWASFVGLIWTLTLLLLDNTRKELNLPLIVCLAVFVVGLIVRMGLAGATKCPLCHGKPFRDTGSVKHRLANKIPGLPWTTSTVLHLLFTGRFRCMYCSTPFRFGRSRSAS